MRTCLALLVSCYWSLAVAQSERTYCLGMLETKYKQYVEGSQDTGLIRIQRPLFRYENGRWHSLQDDIGNTERYPLSAHWYIGFDGKVLGEFDSKRVSLDKNCEWCYPRDVHHKPNTQKLPSVGKPTSEFTGWDDQITARPLVTISHNNVEDPQKWKPFLPLSIPVQRFANVYKNHFVVCSEYQFDVDYDNLKFDKCYASNSGDTLFQLGEWVQENGLDYFNYTIWIYVSSSGEIIDLSKAVDAPHRGNGDAEISNLTLVDAGDYDADGFSDVVFWIDRYNGNGYVLFYNLFSNLSAFEWSYH